MNNKGFGLIELLLIIVLLTAIGFVLWQVTQTNQSLDQIENLDLVDSEQIRHDEAESDQNDVSIITVLEEVIVMSDPGDETLLPGVTPESFKDFIGQKLVDKNSMPNERSCITQYRVSQISDVNIGGNAGS